MCMSARCELFLANVIRWTWRKGKGTPDHPTRMRGGLLWKGGCKYMFVCAMSHGYVAKGCTAHLCDVLQACYPLLCSHILFSPPLPLLSPSLPRSSPSSPLLSPLPLLFFFPLFHFLLQLFAPDSLAMMFCAVLSGGLLPNTYENGKQSGKHLWCEWPIALIRTPYMLTSGTDIYGNYS